MYIACARLPRDVLLLIPWVHPRNLLCQGDVCSYDTIGRLKQFTVLLFLLKDTVTLQDKLKALGEYLVPTLAYVSG